MYTFRIQKIVVCYINVLLSIVTIYFKPASKKNMFTDRSKAVLLLLIIFSIYASCLSCFLVSSMQPCGHLLGKALPLGSLVCGVLWCIVTSRVVSSLSWVGCGTLLY